ncbi:hypothetical protein DEIPH_ctg012orf0098 [Deinococcus phoenicis]|uniref:Uncharacterized protein n=1 Tax=Deinococcus phoenicis TaxID=1476583 RepID=A0A016QSE2_9DEIO|nr:hypothetical protein [Deinococcus phoenicis]EYB69025.1 hypothetical protein DEIPH_ctg012orf0098 [Deinococcus phoenicis]
MNPWRWLTTPDPDPGFTPRKLLKLFVRVLLFALLASLLSAAVRAAGLGKYLDTWWGTLLFVLVLYVPLARFLTVDTFVPRRLAQQRGSAGRTGTGRSTLTSAERRKERNRYAGVRKGPPRGSGGRR